MPAIQTITAIDSIALNTGNTSPHGGAWDAVRNRLWIPNNNPKSFYIYDRDINFQASVAFGDAQTSPRGATFVNGPTDYVLMVNNTGRVFVYNAAPNAEGNYTYHESISPPAGIAQCEGICWIPRLGHYWLLSRQNRAVYRQDPNNAFTGKTNQGTYSLYGGSQDGTIPANNDPRGIAYISFSDEVWVLQGAFAYKYDPDDGSFIGRQALPANDGVTPANTPSAQRGIVEVPTTDTANTHIYVIDNGTDRVYRALAASATDLMPTFGSATITDIVATQGSALPTVTLPAATGGDGTLTYSLSPALPAGVSFDAGTRQLTINPTAIKTQTQYTYTVTDSGGDTDTLTFNLTVNARPAMPPGQVTGVTIVAISSTELRVSWTALTGPLTDYEVSVDDGEWMSAGADDTEILLTGLTPSTTYSVQIRGVNADGNGTASTAVSGRTNALPVMPMPPGQVMGVTVRTLSHTSLRVNWTAIAGVTDYEVSVDDGNWVPAGADDTEYVITNLSPSTAYAVKVRARNADGAGTASAAVSGTTLAPPPMPPRSVQGLQVTFPTATSALLQWTATDAAEGYEVSSGSGYIATGSTRTRYLLKGLARGTQYTFAVRARNDVGAGAAAQISGRTPIASLHNALFFKECVNYFDDGARVSEFGNPSNLVREVADNDYTTFSTVRDYAINIAVNGAPTRVDAILVKGKGILWHSAEPTGGSGVGYRNRRIPATVKNWEGTDVSTVVNGFQHDLYLLPVPFTATSVRLTFTGGNAQIYEIMLLEFGLEIDANGDFTQIDLDFVDREGVIHSDPGGGIVYDSLIGNERDKWQVDYVVKIVPGKTILETPEEFLYWRSENRNHIFCMEPSRFPWRIFPAVFVGKSVPVRYRTDDKTGGEILSFRVSEQ